MSIKVKHRGTEKCHRNYSEQTIHPGSLKGVERHRWGWIWKVAFRAKGVGIDVKVRAIHCASNHRWPPGRLAHLWAGCSGAMWSGCPGPAAAAGKALRGKTQHMLSVPVGVPGSWSSKGDRCILTPMGNLGRVFTANLWLFPSVAISAFLTPLVTLGRLFV